MTAPRTGRGFTIAEARRFRDRAAASPAWFCHDVLGCQPCDYQVAMIEAVRDHPQVSVVGANGCGKDWAVARIICWWQSSRFPAKTIVTGPTARQIIEIVWRELRQAYHDARLSLGGRMLPVEALWETTDNHFALGFSTDRPYNITGFHSPNLLVVVTEAHGMADAHMTMIKRLLPKRLLLTGNAFSGAGEFYDSHHDKSDLYRTLSISAYDSPNVLAGREVVPGMVTIADIDRMAADWGVDSPLFRATVLAEFAQAEDGLIALAWLQDARTRAPVLTDDFYAAGVDVAGPGEDETVLVVRRGPNIVGIHPWRLDDPRGAVLDALRFYGVPFASVNVDAVGIGYYLALHLRDQGFPVRLVNVGTAAHGERYANLKAELYWGLRQRFAAGDVAGLTDTTAQAQLAGIRYAYNARGQLTIERKEDARRRGVRSPDRAEALMLAFAPGGGFGGERLGVAQDSRWRAGDGRAAVEIDDARSVQPAGLGGGQASRWLGRGRR